MRIYTSSEVVVVTRLLCNLLMAFAATTYPNIIRQNRRGNVDPIIVVSMLKLLGLEPKLQILVRVFLLQELAEGGQTWLVVDDAREPAFAYFDIRRRQ